MGIKQFYRIIIMTVFILLAGCVQKTIDEPPVMHDLNDYNLNSLIHDQSGSVLVYFSNAYEQENDLKAQFDRVFRVYNDLATFGRVDAAQVESVQSYSVSKLPSINYYYNGILIDQVSGYPTQTGERLHWAKDMELWMRETVIPGPESDRQFSYYFKGGDKLTFEPYSY